MRVLVPLHRIALSRACVCVTRVCVANACARPLVARRRLAVSIARPAPRFAAARAWLRFGSIGRVSRASAAGVNWTCRTANAGWAARSRHTSVVDASGAIYVIGGYDTGGGGTPLYDVWASTDGGARTGLGPRRWWSGDTRGGYSGGY